LILPETLTEIASNLDTFEIQIDGWHALGEIASYIPGAYPQAYDTTASILHFDDYGESAFLSGITHH
jgi:hypothetical protein